MSQQTINELLDNIVQRLDDESETQGVEYAYMVWVVDPKTGSGDMRFFGETDNLLAMSVRAQHKLSHHLDTEEVVIEAVRRLPPGVAPTSMCECGHPKGDHFFGDNKDNSTPCKWECDCKNYRFLGVG